MEIKSSLNLKKLMSLPFIWAIAFCCLFFPTQKNILAQSDSKDNITIEYLTEETVYKIGEKYIENYIDVYEDNIKMDYKKDDSGAGAPCTYKVTYYIGTFNEDGTPNLGTPAPMISTASQKNYIVNYSIITSQGNKYQFYRQIIVSNDVLKPTSFDPKIYAKLLEISNKENYIYI